MIVPWVSCGSAFHERTWCGQCERAVSISFNLFDLDVNREALEDLITLEGLHT